MGTYFVIYDPTDQLRVGAPAGAANSHPWKSIAIASMKVPNAEPTPEELGVTITDLATLLLGQVNAATSTTKDRPS